MGGPGVPGVLQDGLGRGYTRPSLRQALEPLEGVVDEHPVLVVGPVGGGVGVVVDVVLAVHGHRRDLQVHVRELIEVGGVIDGLHVDRDGRGPLPDMLPVHTLAVK